LPNHVTTQMFPCVQTEKSPAQHHRIPCRYKMGILQKREY
jgi:hypothetical protein